LALAQTVKFGAMLEAHKPWLCYKDEAKQEEVKANVMRESELSLFVACLAWGGDYSKSQLAKESESVQECMKQFLGKACPIAQPSGSVPKLS